MHAATIPRLHFFQPQNPETFGDLSKVPSEFLRQVAGDLWVTLRADDVKFNPGRWCTIRQVRPDEEPPTDYICYVCVAGAVMLRRLPFETAKIRSCVYPGTFGEDGAKICWTLDRLRQGMLNSFICNQFPEQAEAILNAPWWSLKPSLEHLGEGFDFTVANEMSKKRVDAWCDQLHGVADFLKEHGF